MNQLINAQNLINMAKLRIKNDPNKGDPIESSYISKGRTPSDDTADVRDLLATMVGKGYTSLNDEESRGNYARLRSLLGDTQAQKLMTHVFIQNQNPSFSQLPVESKIKSFYDIPSGDEEVSKVLGKVKTLGYGVLPGFRQSSLLSNQQLGGRISPVEETVSKVKLKIPPKLQ